MDTRVQKHFDEDSRRFDGIYSENKSGYQTFIDTRIRGVVMERLRLTRALAPAASDFSLLDVGCGSGRYGIALARLGAGRALGLDFAPRMIALARAGAEEAGVTAKCEFQVGDFLSFKTSERFDLVLAMGYFDYIREPAPHLEGMLAACAGHLLASFPKRWEWRVPIRRARFAFSGSYVRFYDRGEVERLARAAGLGAEQSYLLDFGRDYVLVARPGPRT